MRAFYFPAGIVGRHIQGLIQEKTPLSPNIKEALNKLCDEYQLVDLKLHLFGALSGILSDGTLHLQIQKDTDISILKECLSMKNHWYSPRVELSCREPSEENYQALNEIVVACQFPIIVRIDYDACSITVNSFNLNEMLHRYPSLKSIKVLVPGTISKNFLGHVENIQKMIKENQSLESLYIIFYDMKERSKERYFSTCCEKVISEALETNTTLKKLFFTYTLELDPISKSKQPPKLQRLIPLRGNIGKTQILSWDLKSLEKQALDFDASLK